MAKRRGLGEEIVKTYKHLALCSGALAGLLIHGAANAQSTDEAGHAALEEIIVTAQRRSERLEDVPVAITAISGEALERSGLNKLADIASIAPGVQLGRVGVYYQPAIRGVSTQLVGVGAENNVAVYVDGFYRAFQRGLNIDTPNLAQISILKGPQGTLFGRNATGGAIQIETLQPSTSGRSGRIGVGYGRFNDRRLQAYVNTPVTDNLAFNVAGFYRRSDGYIRDVRGFDSAPIESYAVNAKLLYLPTEYIRVTLGFDLTNIDDGSGIAFTNIGRSQAQVLFPGTYTERRPYRTSLSHASRNLSRLLGSSLKVEMDLGFAKLTSLTRSEYEFTRLNYDLDHTARDLFNQKTDEKNHAFSQEVNLGSTGDGRLNYVIGAFYYNSASGGRGNVVLFYPTTIFGNTSNLGAEAYAAYGDLTYRVGEKWFFTGGIRYSGETKDVFVKNAAGLVLADKSADFHSVTPRAVVRYNINPGSNVYASFSKGFKSGTFNTGAPFNPVDPEKLDAYEIGYKFANSRMRFDLSAYRYNYKDLQVSSLAIINGALTPVTTNAATAKIYGAEAQFSGAITARLTARASVAYNHARYKSFPLAPVNLPNPVTGLNSGTCANPNPPPATRACVENESGLPLVRAPDWTANLGLEYKIPLPNESHLLLAGNLSYTSAYVPTRTDRDLDGEGQRYSQPKYALLNMSVVWTSANDKYSVTTYANNVFDQNYKIYITGQSFGDYVGWGEPQTYGVKVDYRF